MIDNDSDTDIRDIMIMQWIEQSNWTYATW